MVYVEKEEVLELLKGFSQDELGTIRVLFMVLSDDDLAVALAEFINCQPQGAITHSLMINAIEIKARWIEKQLNTVKQNANNN